MAEFGANSTADEVLAGCDLAGMRVLVTGVSAGIGVATARALAARGAEVIGAVRDLAKAEAATSGIAGLALIPLDLSSLASVRACADALLARGESLDLIINNAGIMACPFGRTVDGFETQFGTNHLAHFLLANRLLPLLGKGGRLISLSSAGHRFADVDLQDPNFATTAYSPFGAYGRSKTANILFAVEFDRRHKARGIRAAAVHPGRVTTEISRHMNLRELQGQLATANAQGAQTGAFNDITKNPAQGAATSVWAGIVAPAELVGGKYCEDCHVAEIFTGAPGMPQNAGARPYALDPERAKALWAVSEAMIGETF